MIALINPSAGGGTALEKWARIESRLRRITGAMDVYVTGDAEDLGFQVARALDEGETRFIAGGGDGTVNAVLQSLVEFTPPVMLERISLGAVGLGSSNDFHKPYHLVIGGVPCRIGFGTATRHDVGVLAYTDPEGQHDTRYWLVNASIGTTAEANHFFNHPDRLLRFLKKRSASSGILYAAGRTLLRYRCREMTLWLDDSIETTALVQNIGVVKSPHFAGSLHYDSPHEPDSGDFYVHRLEKISTPRLASAFAGLARGRFTGRRGTNSWKARRLSVRNCGPFAIEFDGEVTVAHEATFSLYHSKIRVCS
jgi:diacylglycerol kinase family enzyme